MNEADPLGVLENVYESRLLRDAEAGAEGRGGAGSAEGRRHGPSAS